MDDIKINLRGDETRRDGADRFWCFHSVECLRFCYNIVFIQNCDIIMIISDILIFSIFSQSV